MRASPRARAIQLNRARLISILYISTDIYALVLYFIIALFIFYYNLSLYNHTREQEIYKSQFPLYNKLKTQLVGKV